jgi:protein TonB
MFNTLVESRATRTRSTKSTMASVLLHGAAIAAAVSLTMTTPGEATIHVKTPDLIYVPIDPQPPVVEHVQPPTPQQPSLPNTKFTIAAPKDIPQTLPPIDLTGPVVPEDKIVIGGPGVTTSPYAIAAKGPFSPTDVVNSDAVERVPHIIGEPRAPRYPDALRQSNVAGNVAVRFVVDTLGRAEMDGLQVMETSHPLFAEAVKNALAFYRFTPGEVGGRKVRTMVQIPFTFSLTK